MKKIMLMALLASANLYAVSEVKLDRTVVSSTAGFEKPIIEENKNVILITSEDIAKKEYTDVESILRDTPNVVIQETEFGPVVNLRGSGERSMSRVKTMVDGITITPLEEAMGTLPINSIPVGSIDKIEIIPGGGATLYGSGTTGGVVNIITKSNAGKNFVTSNLKYGSYASRDVDFAIGQMLDKDFYVNFAGQYTNKNGYRENEELEAKSFSGGFDYKINDRHRVKFQASHFEDNGTSSTDIEKAILEHNRKEAGENIDSDSERKSFALDYEYKPKDNLTFYATAFKTKYERNFVQDSTMDYVMAFGKMPYNVKLKDLNSTMEGNFIEKTEGIKLKSKYQYNKGDLILGYDYTKTNLKRNSFVNTEKFVFKNAVMTDKNSGEEKPNMAGALIGMAGNSKGRVTVDTLIDMDKDTHAVYVLNDYRLTEKLNLTTGIRWEHSDYSGNRSSTATMYGYDYKGTALGGMLFPTGEVKDLGTNVSEIDKTTDDFAGEIGLTYKYSSTGSVYSRYERGFISPLPTQLTNKIDVKGEKLYIDSGLDSETIDSIEFGVRDFIGNSYVSATVFASQTNDEIATLDQNSNNPASKLWKFVNIGETRRLGAELYAEQYFGKLTLSQAVSYVNAEVTKVGDMEDSADKWLEKGDKVPMVSDWKITLGADYQLTEKFSIGANYTYNSGYERRELETYEKTKTSGYGVTDIYAQYAVNENFILKAGVNNVLNEEYNYYETATTAIPAPERNYYGAISIVF